MTIKQLFSLFNSPLYNVEVIDGVNVFFNGKVIDLKKEKDLIEKEIEYWEIDTFKNSIIVGIFR